jgi:hypothetical protein
MASSTTYDSQSLTKELEQRWKNILDIFPCDDTPVLKAAEKVPGSNSILSWNEENITLPTAAKKKIEGAAYSYSGASGAKLTNYVQSIHEADTVTDLNEHTNHPEIGGTNSRVRRTAMLMMEQCLLDLEWSLINGTAAIGNNSTAAEMGGIISFVDSAYTSTAPTASPTAANKRTITYNTENGASAAATTSLVKMLGKNWAVGGRIKRLLVNYNQKTEQFDTFSVGGYQRNTNLSEGSSGGTAVLTYEKVMTAAGPTEIIPHPMIASGSGVGYDPRAFKVVEVEAFGRDKKVARTGDSENVVVKGYYSCKLMNKKAAMRYVNYDATAVP